MPRNASGTYSLPAGNPVVPGTTIQASWANTTMDDLANEITNSLSRTGAGGMLAPFRIADGTVSAPGLAFTNETNSGLYRSGTGNTALVVAGVPVIQMTASSVTVPTGKTFNAQGGAAVTGTLSATGAATLSSTLAVTGAITATGGVVGNVTGNVTAASGTSTFYNAVVTNGLNMSGVKIAALGAPTTDTDAATKAYVDSVAQGIDAKASCLVATTANITLSGTQTIDGVAVIAGDRVLVKDQTSAAENGIYVAAASTWSRASDANTWDELVAAFTFIEQGTVNANSGYVCTVTAGGTLGSTAVTWTQFSGVGQITAGTGMTKSGNTLNVNTASSSRIMVGADEIDLAATGVTASTYKSVTVDIYGRVTGGSNPTTLAGYGITDAYTSSYIDSLFGTTVSAATSAAAAATSATNAGNSATAAASSASSAASSASSAAASYDAFDDRYLGAKSSDPTVDNDGNALLTGALYWNTTSNQMRVYSGSAWAAAYLPAGGYLALSGGTMTGTITFAAGQTISGYLPSTGGAMTGALTMNAQNQVRFADADSSNYVGFQAPAAVASNKIWVLPNADGTNGQALVTNGSGVLSFATVASPIYGLFYKADPSTVAFTKTGAGTAQIKAGTRIEVGGTTVTFSSATTITMPSLTAGTNYAIWVKDDGTIQATSNYSTAPGAGNWRRIGGFHYAPGGNATGTSGGEYHGADQSVFVLGSQI